MKTLRFTATTKLFVLCLAFITQLSHLLIVCSAEATPEEEGLQFLQDNKSKPGVMTLPSGLQYKVLREGNGSYHPSVSSPCECHYEGKLIDGTVFDSSYDRGSPTTFAPNQVIKGWTEAMQLMVEGDKWEMYIPSDLAYGDRGSPPKIPGGSTLIFTMEIISIGGPIEDFVPANRCNVETKEKCNEKQLAYLEKTAAWTDEKKQAEIKRLTSLMGDSRSMKPELAQWVRGRLHLLSEVLKEKDKGEEEEL